MAVLKLGPIPLYYQIEGAIRRKISSGEFAPGSRLPSEEALAREYKVSRVTVRQALSRLETQGLIVRRRGKGTFVTEKAASFETPKFTGSMEHLISMGLRTSVRIMDFGMIKPPQRVREALELGRASRVLRIEKVRLVEDKPFSYVLNFFPPEIGKRMSLDEALVKPVLKILEDDLGIRLAHAIERIEATTADEYISSLLEIDLGNPLLKMERTVYDEANRAVEYVSVLYRADKYFVTVKLQRAKAKKTFYWAPAVCDR